jgi:hypothetical protein
VRIPPLWSRRCFCAHPLGVSSGGGRMRVGTSLPVWHGYGLNPEMLSSRPGRAPSRVTGLSGAKRPGQSRRFWRTRKWPEGSAFSANSAISLESALANLPIRVRRRFNDGVITSERVSARAPARSCGESHHPPRKGYPQDALFAGNKVELSPPNKVAREGSAFRPVLAEVASAHLALS